MDTQDTLAEWLYARFDHSLIDWENMLPEDQEKWRHDARAVRRAVARGGFKSSDSEPLHGEDEGIAPNQIELLSMEADVSRRMAHTVLAALVRLGRPSRVSGE